jgi:hypothetical protein
MSSVGSGDRELLPLGTLQRVMVIASVSCALALLLAAPFVLPRVFHGESQPTTSHVSAISRELSPEAGTSHKIPKPSAAHRKVSRTALAVGDTSNNPQDTETQSPGT